MYVDRHADRPGINPVGLGASLTINAAIILGLIYAAPEVMTVRSHPTLITLIPIEPPPPPLPTPQPHPRTAAAPLTAPQPKIDVPQPGPTFDTSTTIDLTPFRGGDGPDILPLPEPSATPMPALIGASVDPRHARDFQPSYPPAERRANHQGRVVVRVLIGVDGRVKQIEKISAASDAFFAATRDQALSKWRFKPATRGDVPVEQWKQMSVSFVLDDS
ncbi:TonB family protein [Sphingomonas koreensis]|nr:TonB family protein [Sphingomonas koreensis]